MALDSLVIAGLANELNHTLEGARIDKIYMPRRDRVVLNLRLQQGSGKLLLAAGGDARVHLTEEKFENPDVPPMLCMLLRKQLSSGRFLRAVQPEGERILDLCFSAADEMGFIGEKHLICELTGRLTNVILTDGEGLILGCMKPVDHEMSDRAVLPGLRYRLPPKPDKPSLTDLTEEQLTDLCRQAEDARALCGMVSGVSPLCARECLHRAGGDAALWAKELKNLCVFQPAPYLLEKADGSPADISALEITCRDDVICTRQNSFSALLDAFYLKRSREEGLKNASQQLVRNITTLKSRLERKLAAQQQELLSASQREKLKEQADLITANLYAIKQGDSKAVVVDYFAEGMPMRYRKPTAHRRRQSYSPGDRQADRFGPRGSRLQVRLHRKARVLPPRLFAQGCTDQRQGSDRRLRVQVRFGVRAARPRQHRSCGAAHSLRPPADRSRGCCVSSGVRQAFHRQRRGSSRSRQRSCRHRR